MNRLNFIAVAFSFATCAISIFQSVYATRHPVKGSKMSVLRSILASASLTLTVCGAVAVFTVSSWFAVASALGLACGFVDCWLAKYDLNDREKELIERFHNLDGRAQVALVRAIDLNQRVVIYGDDVLLDGAKIAARPIDVREAAAQGLLVKIDEERKTFGKGLDLMFINIEIYATTSEARETARLIERIGSGKNKPR